MGPKRLLIVLVVIAAAAASCGGSKQATDVAASVAPTVAPGTAIPTVAPTASPPSTASVAPAATPAPTAARPTATPYQTMTSAGCTVSAAPPPYRNGGDFVHVAISGTCTHMRAPDTGEIIVAVDGKNHGETNDVPHFDAYGHYSAKPFISQDGKVCGHTVTITVQAKYDFNKNLSDRGTTTFKLVCDKP